MFPRFFKESKKWELNSEKEEDTTNKLKNKGQEDKTKDRIQNGERTKNKGRNKENKDNEKPKNPCKLPGHQNHDWSDCFNNPKSHKFKGAARNFEENENGKKKGGEGNHIKENSNSHSSSCKTISWSNSLDSDSE